MADIERIEFILRDSTGDYVDDFHRLTDAIDEAKRRKDASEGEFTVSKETHYYTERETVFSSAGGLVDEDDD